MCSVDRHPLRPTKSFPDGAPQREEYDNDKSYNIACEEYEAERDNKKLPFTAGVTCDECPWRKDVPVGRFPPSRFRGLRKTVEQGFMPIFACHKTLEGRELACTGYLKSIDSENNFTVRLAIVRNLFDPRQLEAKGPLFSTYAEMEKANRRRKAR